MGTCEAMEFAGGPPAGDEKLRQAESHPWTSSSERKPRHREDAAGGERGMPAQALPRTRGGLAVFVPAHDGLEPVGYTSSTTLPRLPPGLEPRESIGMRALSPPHETAVRGRVWRSASSFQR